MKKILFVNNNLEIGGVQTSLLNLLKEIQDDYDVTLLLFNLKKEYLSKIPAKVKVIETKSAFKQFGLSKKDVKGNAFAYMSRVFWFILTNIFGRYSVTKLMGCTQRKLKGYDYAISFLHEMPQKSLYGGCNEFVLNKVEANQKIAWIHCDFEQSGANNKQSRKIYEKFDKILACSDGVREKFIKCMPKQANKCYTVKNCNDYERIRSLSQESVSYEGESLNLVTVARLSSEKGIDRAIQAVKTCLDNGINVRYHIVGDGREESRLKGLVQELGLQEKVVLYGAQDNPYKFIKNADLLVLTSRHEAAPMVFDEAISLGVPVFATKTTSTREMILDRDAGFVCENTQEGITKGLLACLQNEQFLTEIRENLRTRKYNNDLAIKSFKNVIANR